MRKLLITLTVVIALCLTTNSALAVGDPNDGATASVTVTVDNIVEWADTAFSTIAISDHITAYGSTPDANQSLVLYTNGNVDITADNSTAARLDKTDDPNQILITSYKLTYDEAAGGSTTGGSTVDWTDYSTFLSSASTVSHAAGDGAVEVTLWAKAANPSGEVADAGSYSAVQTLTAAWGT